MSTVGSHGSDNYLHPDRPAASLEERDRMKPGIAFRRAWSFVQPTGNLSNAVAVDVASRRQIPRRGWSVRRRWRMSAVALVGAAAASGVGYLVNENPQAVPPHLAVGGRVAIIVVLFAVGLYAQTNRVQARMGRLLVAAGVFSSLWLLNGSSNATTFSIGRFLSGFAPLVFCTLMLLNPTGGLRSRADRILPAAAGSALALTWSLLTLASTQPPFTTPLIRCAPGCPTNILFVRPLALGDGATDALRVVVIVSWVVLAWGTWLLLARRMRSASLPLRRSIMVVAWAAGAYALIHTAYAVLDLVGAPIASHFGTADVAIALAVPLAIFAGLGLERLFMGQSLAEFVTNLTQLPQADPQVLMAVALRDPSLKIAYRRRGAHASVDASGAPVATDALAPGRAITWIERGSQPVAAVIYDEQLTDQERFVRAAGAAALMRLEHVQLEAELTASTADLEASRIRLVEAADAERQRIERDLHDSIQQDLVGLRIKLQMAVETLKEEPLRGEQVIASVGRQMDDVLEALRSLARGIYPSLLHERGLVEALRSAGRRLPLPVSVLAGRQERCPEAVEVAVYFCCLEALQNVVKHAGREAAATVRLRREPERLFFEVSDSGSGFDVDAVSAPHGLVNMRDRIAAVGGQLRITSRKGRGTSVRGVVPIAP
jgi:signal transduction histidine kinase